MATDQTRPGHAADQTHDDQTHDQSGAQVSAESDVTHGDVGGDPGGRPMTGPASHGGGSRTRPSRVAQVGGAFRELVIVVVMALALSFVVKTWLVQAFWIPSQSMENTLIRNDRVLVNKLSPGLVDLHRGDVVVFADPDNWLQPTQRADRGPVLNAVRDGLIFVGLLPSPSDDHLIKRLIGLPGDHIVCCDKDQRLTVNGVAITEPYVKPGNVPSTLRFDITVPADKIWVMGDNRGNSEDSRYHDPSGTGAEGSVPIADVSGRAFSLVWPLNRFSWLSDYPDTFAKVPAAATSTPKVPATTGSTP